MQTGPTINITIPVFNRLEKTQQTILALRKTHQTIPFVITVVNNGSEPELSSRLLEFKKAGIIDNLFVLKRNMGIACAANLGWRLVEAPYYMKLDNDVVIHDKNWASKIFTLWRHGEPYSTIGGAYDYAMLTHFPGHVSTPDGILGLCLSNLPGHAILVPRHLSDILGYWNEDYGLYGAEDGDYGLRMNAAGYKQYYYNTETILTHIGVGDSHEYTRRGINKKEEWESVFTERNGTLGLFLVNALLYEHCARSWRVPQRYLVADIDSECRVHLKESQEYIEFRKGLDSIQRLMNNSQRKGKFDVLNHIEKYKSIIRSCCNVNNVLEHAS